MHRWSSFWAHRCSSCWARSTPGDSGSWVRKWASFESRNPPRTRETRACGTHEVMAIWKMINQRLRWSPMTISCGQGGDSTTNQTMNSSSMLIYQNCIARWQCFLFMDTKVVSAFGYYIWCIYIYIYIDIAFFPFEEQILQIDGSTTKQSPWNSPSSNLCASVNDIHHMIGERGCSFSFEFRESGHIHPCFSFVWKNYLHCSGGNRVFTIFSVVPHSHPSSLRPVFPVDLPTVQALVRATRGCLKRTQSRSVPLENWPSRSERMAGTSPN